jgi:predicted enzyme related to lactoylglutathione lyase
VVPNQPEATSNRRLAQIVVPVADIGIAAEFFTRALGFALKFRDGPRYAAIDAGPVVVALVSGAEDITEGETALALAVTDVDSEVARLLAAGATLFKPPEDGPHERRAVVHIADLVFVLYAKR